MLGAERKRIAASLEAEKNAMARRVDEASDAKAREMMDRVTQSVAATLREERKRSAEALETEKKRADAMRAKASVAEALAGERSQRAADADKLEAALSEALKKMQLMRARIVEAETAVVEARAARVEAEAATADMAKDLSAARSAAVDAAAAAAAAAHASSVGRSDRSTNESRDGSKHGGAERGEVEELRHRLQQRDAQVAELMEALDHMRRPTGDKQPAVLLNRDVTATTESLISKLASERAAHAQTRDRLRALEEAATSTTGTNAPVPSSSSAPATQSRTAGVWSRGFSKLTAAKTLTSARSAAAPSPEAFASMDDLVGLAEEASSSVAEHRRVIAAQAASEHRLREALSHAAAALELAGPAALVRALSATVGVDGSMLPGVAAGGQAPSEARRAVVRALANLASRPEQHAAVVGAGAVPALLRLLEAGAGEDEGTRRAAAGVLANLAMSPECHATILAARALPTLLALARESSAATTATRSAADADRFDGAADAAAGSEQTRLLVVGALANLMGNPQHKESLAESGALTALIDVCDEARPEGTGASAAAASTSALDLAAQAARGVANYCVRHPPAARAVIERHARGLGALLRLAAGTGEPSVGSDAAASVHACQKHAGLALFHLAQCPGASPRVLEAGGLNALLKMQRSDREDVRRIAARCLSTLTAAGTEA